ncbi:hypothetical protein [Deinococcus marmoris]|uniref:hypothetical protein n=1 Tax=Deinococcus marmoris TaxID=249408 RepID=UPI0012DBDEA9|nr:hypothetical protein [Deinococcus marmoris]
MSQGQQLDFAFAFGKKRKKLRSAPFYGAGAGPENGPEIGSGVVELNGSMKEFDGSILHDLIGVRISCTRFMLCLHVFTSSSIQYWTT